MGRAGREEVEGSEAGQEVNGRVAGLVLIRSSYLVEVWGRVITRRGHSVSHEVVCAWRAEVHLGCACQRVIP